MTLTPLRSLTDKVQSIRFPLLTNKERLTILNQLQTEIIKEAIIATLGEIKTTKIADGGWEARTTKGDLVATAYREREAIAKLKKKMRHT